MERRVHLPALDGLRAYAILGIVLLHVLAFSGVLTAGHGLTFETIAWGTVGNVVEAFFILSGFALFLPVVNRGGELGSARDFYVRRAARIYPAYWLSLAVLLILMTIELPTDLVAGMPSLGEVLVQITGLGMPARLFDSSFQLGFGVNGVLWFVSIVICFYLAFPLIARAYYLHPLAGLVAAGAISLLWRLAAVELTGVFAAIEGSETPHWLVELIVVEQLPGWAFSFGAE